MQVRRGRFDFPKRDITVGINVREQNSVAIGREAGIGILLSSGRRRNVDKGMSKLAITNLVSVVERILFSIRRDRQMRISISIRHVRNLESSRAASWDHAVKV